MIAMHSDEIDDRGLGRYSRSPWLWSLLGVLPFWVPYFVHFAKPAFSHSDRVPTGYIFYDMPYYSAIGRAVFERGNAFAGPNPNDADPEAPAIYFHWINWALGLGITQFGIDPGLLFVGLGAVGGLACGRMTLALVAAVLPRRDYLGPLFLVAMWGGGLLIVAGLAKHLLFGGRLTENVLAFDPGEGNWHLYWGRNIVFPTEAVYHALAAAIWLATIRGRHGLAIVWTVILATTHPYSGLQLLAILGCWWAIRCLWQRDWFHWIEGGLLAVITAAFLSYYFIYLEQFPAHRQLRAVWTLDWNTPLSSQLLAYAPVLALVAARIWSCRRRGESLTQADGFFAVAALVSLGMANHHWLVRAHQPLHFTRGYAWFAILMIGLPQLQRALLALAPMRPRISSASRRWGVAALVVGCAGAVCFDNAVYVAATSGRAAGGTMLTADQWDILESLRDTTSGETLVSEDRRLAYFATTYASIRPMIGHEWTTPHIAERTEDLERWLDGGSAPTWIADVDLLILRRPTYEERGEQLGVTSPAWSVRNKNDGYYLLARDAEMQPSAANTGSEGSR